MRPIIFLPFFLLLVELAAAQEVAPILDMHLHAMGANDQGPAPIAICAPFSTFSAWDQRQEYPNTFMGRMKNPPCEDPVWSPSTDEDLRDETIAVMRRRNIFGVLGGSTARVQEWQAAAPGRFIPGLNFNISPNTPSPDSLRALVETGAVSVLAEVTTQLAGIAPDDERMAPYWDLAEELDLPVGLHMGPGPMGVNYLGANLYRASLSSALLLENVLVRHPRLRVYVMHAGYPLLDDMLALLYAHPQVYVEVGVVVFTRSHADFYRYLKALVDAGFEDRIMFGTDQMVWPGAIERAIDVINNASFLNDSQKRAILYDNAARFLRLSPEEQDRHWGR